MIYLKDTLTGTCRAFNDKLPREKRKAQGFLKARKYGLVEAGKMEVVGRRWTKTDKKTYDEYMKTKKLIELIDVDSDEIE